MRLRTTSYTGSWPLSLGGEGGAAEGKGGREGSVKREEERARGVGGALSTQLTYRPGHFCVMSLTILCGQCAVQCSIFLGPPIYCDAGRRD